VGGELGGFRRSDRRGASMEAYESASEGQGNDNFLMHKISDGW
jgi:hypothetical protein